MVSQLIKKYKTIYCDPPWYEIGGGKIKRGADKHYPLMKTEEIVTLSPKIHKLTEDNAHLWLWCTNSFLRDALIVMKKWGFTYKNIVTWYKKGNIGLGQYLRGCTEHCLFGVKGVLPYKVINGKRA